MDWLSLLSAVFGGQGGSSGGSEGSKKMSWISQTDSEKAESYSGFSTVMSGFSGYSGEELARLNESTQAPFWQWGGTDATTPNTVLQQSGGASSGVNWGLVAIVGAVAVAGFLLLKKGR